MVFLLTMGLILVLGSVLVILYLLRDPKWEYTYGNDSYSLLDDYLYSFDEGKVLRGVLWFQSVQNYDSNTVLRIFNNGELTDVVLPVSLQHQTEDTLYDIVVNQPPYALYLSISFIPEKKSIIDELFCSYLRDGHCVRDSQLDSWRMYKNRFPYPELTEEESMSMYIEMLNFFTNKVNNPEQEPILITLTEYILDKGESTQAGEYQLFNNPDLSSRIKLKQLSLITPEHNYYESLRTELCDWDGYEYYNLIFRESELLFIELICKKPLKSSSLSKVESVESRLLSELRKFNYSLVQDKEYDILLRDGVFNGLNNPHCRQGYEDDFCSEYLLNLYKILLNEISEYEASL